MLRRRGYHVIPCAREARRFEPKPRRLPARRQSLSEFSVSLDQTSPGARRSVFTSQAKKAPARSFTGLPPKTPECTSGRGGVFKANAARRSRATGGVLTASWAWPCAKGRLSSARRRLRWRRPAPAENGFPPPLPLPAELNPGTTLTPGPMISVRADAPGDGLALRVGSCFGY